MSNAQPHPEAPTIRPLEPDDLYAVVALAIPAWQQVPDGRVAGYVALANETDAGIGHVEQIAVHPDYQRRGYARANGMVMANVGTGGDPGHAPARSLYGAVGFVGVPLVNYYLPIE